VCIDGNKLKNERKYTPYIEKMTENRHHGGQKGIHWWDTYYSAELTSKIAVAALTPIGYVDVYANPLATSAYTPNALNFFSSIPISSY